MLSSSAGARLFRTAEGGQRTLLKRYTVKMPSTIATASLWDRPLDLCLIDGIAMYIARLGDGFILKRMPNTGSHHAPDCPSYEPPTEFSGLEQVLGSAIIEDPDTGETTLKLDFSMSKNAGRSAPFSASRPHDSVVADGTKLSLRSLLHYLWDQAELTRWKPEFVGKRSWATVRRHLLQAAENKIARGDALHELADSLIKTRKWVTASPVWFWHTAQQAMPPLPAQIRKLAAV